jgi:hypothetical protein
VYLQGAVTHVTLDRLAIQDNPAIWQYLRQGLTNRTLSLPSGDPAVQALLAGNKPLTDQQKAQISTLVKGQLTALQKQQATAPEAEQMTIAQEMVQLYALFDLGPDMVLTFAPMQEANPQEWRQILRFAGVDVPGVVLMDVANETATVNNP